MLCDCECCRWGKAKALSSVGLQEATTFLSTKGVPRNWKMDISEILESSSSDEEDGAAAETDEEEQKREEKTEEVAVSLDSLSFFRDNLITCLLSNIVLRDLACFSVFSVLFIFSLLQLSLLGFASSGKLPSVTQWRNWKQISETRSSRQRRVKGSGSKEKAKPKNLCWA